MFFNFKFSSTQLFICLLSITPLLLTAQNVGIGTTMPLARLHVADSSVLFSASGYPILTPGQPPIQGLGRRMMWYSDKAAFRAGFVDGSQWNKDSIGMASFAGGYNAKASGNQSVSLGLGTSASGLSSIALGVGAIASGEGAVAIGFDCIASGDISTAMGYKTTAKSGLETTVGTCNTNYTPTSLINWFPTDRLFVVGNGSEQSMRSDAMVILKNGNIGIGNSLPSFKLSFAPVLGDKISLWSNSTNSYGFGIQSSLLQIHTDISATDIVFGYGSSTAFSETMRIKGTGNVGIGNPNPNAKLDVNGTIRFSNVDCINNFCPPNSAIRLTPNLHLNATTDYAVIVNWDNINAGTDSPSFRVGNGDAADVFFVNYSGDAWLQGTLTQASDIRLKKDIQPLQHSLEKITKLNGYNYHWKSSNLSSDLQTGVIAQEVQKQFPELVHEDANGILSVNYSGLIPVLMESTKELKDQIEELKKQNEEILQALKQLQHKK